MKTPIYVLLFFIFLVQACNYELNMDETVPPESDLRLKIVDSNYHDLIYGIDEINKNKIDFFYKDKLGEQPLDFTIYYYETAGAVLDVKRIPELSSSGIKNFYLRFNNYPVDSFYIDIRQKSDLYCTSDWFNYIEMKCNGIPMEFNGRYILYYIKK